MKPFARSLSIFAALLCSLFLVACECPCRKSPATTAPAMTAAPQAENPQINAIGIMPQ